jgi:hypothetical protein
MKVKELIEELRKHNGALLKKHTMKSLWEK